MNKSLRNSPIIIMLREFIQSGLSAALIIYNIYYAIEVKASTGYIDSNLFSMVCLCDVRYIFAKFRTLFNQYT